MDEERTRHDVIKIEGVTECWEEGKGGGKRRDGKVEGMKEENCRKELG